MTQDEIDTQIKAARVAALKEAKAIAQMYAFNEKAEDGDLIGSLQRAKAALDVAGQIGALIDNQQSPPR